jgi:hypothetical protein
VQQILLAEVVPNVSSKNSKATMERTTQLGIRVTSCNAKLHSKENLMSHVDILFVLKGNHKIASPKENYVGPFI